MCGITGFWDVAHRLGAEHAAVALRRMTRALRRRGPDDEGLFHDATAGIALGHRRLSVIDLSPEGHQPMVSAGGRFVMTYNGEIYNHRALRQELAALGNAFRGHSDTEVMLAAIEQWGLDKALERFTGMFAFALWDRRERVLTLVRDRLGIKPLYYGRVGTCFVFASELKAITAMPGFDNAIDRDALCLLLRHGYIAAPHCIYRGLRKLEPGTVLTLGAGDIAKLPAARTHAFWSARATAIAGMADRLSLSDAEAAGELERLLRDAVALRMEADVPLGAFLSGGIDSSLVVALMQAQSTRAVQTFTIGFREKGYDEAAHARAVAKHLHAEHHELYVTAQDALEVVPKLSGMFDEPFSDASQIPTFLVAQLARRHVTVGLSGDGGDELFVGYRRYSAARGVERGLNRLPPGARRLAARSLVRHAGFYESLLAAVNAGLPARLKLRRPRAKVEMLADMLGADSQDERYRLMMSHSRHPAETVLRANEPSLSIDNPVSASNADGVIERMMYDDLVAYLPGDILAKVDRASMAVSLEARVPLLDHRVVEFAWRIPMAQKVRGGQGKWLLREVLHRYLPRPLMDRPKQGFSVPIGAWLRGPLRDWAESLLDARRLREEGYFEPGHVRRLLARHLAGSADEGTRLWDVLMFQAWLSQATSERAPVRDEVAA